MTDREINERIVRYLQKGDKTLDELMVGYEERIVKAYASALKGIKRDIAAMYEKYGDDVSYKDMVSYQRLSNLETQIKNTITELKGQNNKAINKALSTFAEESYNVTGYAIEQGVKTSLGLGLIDKKVIDSMLINPLDRVTWSERLATNADVYVTQIKGELARGLIQGEGYSKIAKKITEQTKLSADKTIRIVRTEGHRVQSTARLIQTEKAKGAAERLGMKLKKIWVATNDDRTRDRHAEMDGVEADDDGVFTLPDGVTTDGPGLSGVAEHDINCRCTVRTEFVDIPQEVSGGADDTEDQSYEKWKDSK